MPEGEAVVLRIHFTADDLVRVRIVDEAQLMWELVLSLHLLEKPEGGIVFSSWRDQVRASLRSPRLAAETRLLHGINPRGPYIPDFLTPVLDEPGPEPAIDAVLSTSRTRIRGEIASLSRHVRLSSSVRRLADGDREALGWLGASLRDYYAAAIEPQEQHIRARIDEDRALRTVAMLGGGVAGLFESFRPDFRWRPPVLEARYPFDKDVHLGGRGLLLVPSFFCWRMPVTLADPNLTPVLVYPIGHGGRRHESILEADLAALQVLLGSTRARVLDGISGVLTSRQLASRLGLSESSVSEHTAVLRQAGLIASRRHRNTLLHMRTPLGTALLGRRAASGTIALEPPAPETIGSRRRDWTPTPEAVWTWLSPTWCPT